MDADHPRNGVLIARRSTIGYSAVSFIDLFADLDDLLDHVNAAILDPLSAAFAAAAAEAPIRALADTYLDFALANPGLYGALFAQREGRDRRPPASYAAKVSALLAPLETATALAPDAGDANAESEALALWAAIHGVAALESADKLGGTGRAAELADLVLTRWLDGRRSPGERA